MQRAYKPGVAAFAALAVLGFGAWLYAQESRPGLHPLNESCGSCHLAGIDTAANNAAMLIASQEQLCGRCHANALKMSHPSGFTPPSGKIIPPVYPLDWKGDLTCSTCHEVHSDLPGKLRGTATGRDMCLACHDRAFFDNMRDGGTSVMQLGHLGIPNSQNWQNLDPYSIQCMECHANRGDVNVDSNQILRHGSQNHPIGRSYAAAERYGGYRPAFLLPKKIPLPNGMVSCISCHEGYARNHGKVIASGNTTSLCFECHDK